MTPEQFVYWLQGFTEFDYSHPPTKDQWQMIVEHLRTVFHKVTPTYIPPTRVSDTIPVPDWTARPQVIC